MQLQPFACFGLNLVPRFADGTADNATAATAMSDMVASTSISAYVSTP